MKFLVLGLMVFSGALYADETKSISLKCSAEQLADMDFTSQIYLNIDSLKVDELGTSGVLSHYSMTIVNMDQKLYDVIPSVEASTFEGNDVENSEYNGRKYVDHLKFDLNPEGKTEMAGNLGLDRANLIVAPAYRVVKTVPQKNHWDDSWTWDIEVRKHSAVLDISFNDHHGDYIQLECFSYGKVNEKGPKGRK